AAEVSLFFVDPAAIGQGVGTRLWRHLIGEARRRGVERIVVESDPNAEGFYLAMGARTVGAVPSRSIANRLLPLMELALTG
ncbi:MAG: GNAT family N-acetyltransferase, partial [Alphaproteobacteria bacterium]